MHERTVCFVEAIRFFNNDAVLENEKKHNPNSSLLVGELTDDVKVYPVKVTVGKKVVKSLFD